LPYSNETLLKSSYFLVHVLLLTTTPGTAGVSFEILLYFQEVRKIVSSKFVEIVFKTFEAALLVSYLVVESVPFLARTLPFFQFYNVLFAIPKKSNLKHKFVQNES